MIKKKNKIIKNKIKITNLYNDKQNKFIIQMELYTKVKFIKIKNKVKEFKYGRMEQNIKENGKMIKLVVREFYII